MASVLTVFLTIFPISLASDSVDFTVVHQTSTDTTLECSYNGKVETYPSIRVNHNGRTIRETANSTKLMFATATPLCGKEKHFSCVVNYDDKRIPKDLMLLPSHDRPTISTAENKSPCLAANKMVTVVCLVKNLCIKENVWFVESHDYSLLSQDLFFDEVTSSRGERRYFATAVASVTFHRGGKVNGTCRATSGESTTKAIDIFDCQKNKMDEQQITIITNGLSSFPAEKMVKIGCSVKNLLLKENISIVGDHFYRHEEATVFYAETTSDVGKKNYIATAAVRGTFREEGVSILICSTESGRSATKAITVEKKAEIPSNGRQTVFIHTNGLHRVYANEITRFTCTVVNMISRGKVWFDGNNFYQPREPDIFYIETTAEAGKKRYYVMAKAEVVFVKSGDFNLTCLTANGGYATKSITVEEKVNSDAYWNESRLGLIIVSICFVVICLFFFGYCLRKAWPRLRVSCSQGNQSANDVSIQLEDQNVLNNGLDRASSHQGNESANDVSSQSEDQNVQNDGLDRASSHQGNKSANDASTQPEDQNVQNDGPGRASSHQGNKSANDASTQPEDQNVQNDGPGRVSSSQGNKSVNDVSSQSEDQNVLNDGLDRTSSSQANKSADDVATKSENQNVLNNGLDRASSHQGNKSANDASTQSEDQNVLNVGPDRSKMDDSFRTCLFDFRKGYYPMDVTIQVQDTEITVHRLVLIAGGGVLRQLFEENYAGNKITIKEDVTLETFKTVLEFISTGSCDVNNTNLFDVTRAATVFKLDKLEKYCASITKTKLAVSNVGAHASYAVELDAKESVKVCQEYFRTKILQISKTDEFLEVSYNVLLALCSSDGSDAITCHEIDVFLACVEWAKRECQRKHWEVTPANQRTALGDVLTKIRFPVMKREEFLDKVSPLEILTYDEVGKLIVGWGTKE